MTLKLSFSGEDQKVSDSQYSRNILNMAHK